MGYTQIMDKEPIDLDYEPTKSLSELLAGGIPQKGGLALLASAEKAGPRSYIEPVEMDSRPPTSTS